MTTEGFAGRRQAGGQLQVWDIRRLWEHVDGLPVVQVAIDKIQGFDSADTWYGDGVDSPTCRSVAMHAKRIMDCSLEHPVILASDNCVLDGMHRVAKAWLLGKASVPAVRFDDSLTPDLVVTECDGIDPDGIMREIIERRHSGGTTQV